LSGISGILPGFSQNQVIFMGLHPRLLHHILRGMGQFGDGRLSDKSVIRHDTFDESAFVYFFKHCYV